MDRHRLTTAFVVDGDGGLAGAVGENDIRRALLRGHDLDSTVARLIRRPTVTVGPDDGRAEVLDLMRALRVSEIPIVDAKGMLAGLHIEEEIVGMPELENWAVIMAGGRGERLAPLTKDVPKPMLPVAGRPILERLVLHLVGAGIRNIFISVNYLADIIEKHFGDGSKFGCRIEYLREDTDRPLGSGGSLGLLPDSGYRSAAPLLVMNGDLITAFSVREMLETHSEYNAVATIAVSTYEHQVPFGVMEARDDALVRMVEKPTHSWPVNAGIYVIEPDLLSRIPPGQLFPITDLFTECLQRKERVMLWQLRDWKDIGRPAELAEARGQM
ncbi:sugar phosphate nucleotidyltransferase [Amycolatopsis pithecellobii]|uniref:sugar phosphate nucleotidyltransferase n=1 Tax=Amycolatopsis pithecellobii TaxID=664692 RepID=UPI0035E404C9